MENTIKIGRCPGCNKMTKLQGVGCLSCISRMGERMIKIFGKVRSDPSLAIKCYARLQGAHRDRFVEMFGNPSTLSDIKDLQEFIITVELENGETYDIRA